MRQTINGRWIIPAAALLVVTYLGCRGGSTPDEIEPSGTPTEGQQAPDETAAKTEASVVQTTPDEKPPPPTIPEVLLPDALRQTCLVGVGDPMPQAELADPAGQTHALAEMLGEELTVLFFWTRGDTEFTEMAAQMALEDLQKDVHEPYAEKGVQVIGINEGNTPEDVQKLVNGAGATFATLLDPDGALFAQVAKEKLPRAYLLDAEGKILWFDLEYSRTTRDNLMQAIQVALEETARE